MNEYDLDATVNTSHNKRGDTPFYFIMFYITIASDEKFYFC